MIAPLSIRDFARVVLPPGSDGGLCMLTTYFDDSGTHTDSDVVVWSGLCGNEHQWAFFNRRWREKLENPSPGKLGLSKFHRTDCHNSTGEFSGWSRTASDYLALELSDIIAAAGLANCGGAVSRKDWDRLVAGNWRAAWGDAEQHCILRCFAKAVKWAQDRTSDGHMAFVFDDRPHRNEQVKKIFDVYRRTHGAYARRPEIDSITFTLSSRFLPLQAADLVAWEQYQYVKAYLKGGSDPATPKSLAFARLLKKSRMDFQIVDQKEIDRMFRSKLGTAEKVAEIAANLRLDFSGDWKL